MADPAFSSQIAVTNNEPAGEKHLVEPYPEQPKVSRQIGGRDCIFCGNTGFRRSRLRLADALTLLLLQLPVRCTRCGHRQRVSLPAALAARPPRRRMGL